MLLDIKSYYKTEAVNPVLVKGYKYCSEKGIESSKIYPPKHGQLIFETYQDNPMGRQWSFQHMCWKN